MTPYDAIIVLCSQPDPTTWKFPPHIYDALRRAKQLLEDEQAPYVITAGKWSIALDNKRIKQPFRECDLAANFLTLLAVPPTKILKEGESKDSISNLYYLKTELFIPRRMKKLLIVVAGFRVARLQYVCDKVLGPDYEVSFDSIPAQVSPSYNEENTTKVQKKFLDPMQNGDHEWLAGKFYTAPMYHYWEKYDKV